MSQQKPDDKWGGYRPHPKQVEFLEADEPRVCYLGGHGVVSRYWAAMFRKTLELAKRPKPTKSTP